MHNPCWEDGVDWSQKLDLPGNFNQVPYPGKKRKGKHAWHDQLNLSCLWLFTTSSPFSIPTPFHVIAQDCVYNHDDHSRWKTVRDLCYADEKKSLLCRSVLQPEHAACRKLSITVSHLKSHLKTHIDPEVLPLLVLGIALQDVLIYFEALLLQRILVRDRISREEVV